MWWNLFSLYFIFTLIGHVIPEENLCKDANEYCDYIFSEPPSETSNILDLFDVEAVEVEDSNSTANNGTTNQDIEVLGRLNDTKTKEDNITKQPTSNLTTINISDKNSTGITTVNTTSPNDDSPEVINLHDNDQSPDTSQTVSSDVPVVPIPSNIAPFNPYPPPHIIPETVVKIQGHISTYADSHPFKKHWPLLHLEKWHPKNVLKPITNKISKLHAYWSHPNYGGINAWSPSQVWHKVHDNSHNFFTGIHGSIFGFGNIGNYDYPFAYRSFRGVNIAEDENLEKDEHQTSSKL